MSTTTLRRARAWTHRRPTNPDNSLTEERAPARDDRQVSEMFKGGPERVCRLFLQSAGRCGARGSLLRSQHHHNRPRLHPTVEIDHILIGQPDATRRNRMSDPSGLVRAVDAIERVLPVGIKVEGAGAHWIGCTAFDVIRKRS